MNEISEIEVIFDHEAHTYEQGGVRVPRSVSGLLKKYGLTMDFSRVPHRVLELARQRGKAFAEGRRLILKGYTLDPSTVDQRIECYLTAFKRFWKESGAKLIETEVPRVSPLGFGFTADIYCWIGGRRVVVDDKATFKLPKSIGPQTAGYKVGWNSLYPNEPIEERYALHLRKDGTYRAPLLNDVDDEVAFMDCLVSDIKLEKWRTKYGE